MTDKHDDRQSEVHKLVLDRGRCTGHGRCYSLHPTLFEPDDAGFGHTVVASVSAEEVEGARRALNACPEQAISLVAIDRPRPLAARAVIPLDNGLVVE